MGLWWVTHFVKRIVLIVISCSFGRSRCFLGTAIPSKPGEKRSRISLFTGFGVLRRYLALMESKGSFVNNC